MNIGAFIVIFAAVAIVATAIGLTIVTRADRRQGTERMYRPKPPDDEEGNR
jgi:hypothetical protein